MDRTPDHERRRARIVIVVLMALSLVTLGAGLTSLAVWTDSDTSTGSFTAGTIDIAATPSTILTVTGMVPGSSGSATLTVANNGTAALRYAMSSSSTNSDSKGLRNQLQLTVSPGSCPGGTALYGPAAIASAAFGSAAQGDDTGDRTLAAGASESLCFAWSLPSSTGDAYQGSATTTTFTFSAEQTANNP